MYAKNGIHLFRTNLPPDDWLLRLNPQSVVLVGSYEHQDAVLATQAAAAKLVGLLPNAIVKVRWWKDDDILRTISPAGFARLFFPLHVPGTHLGVGNEDAQNADDPRVFAETVRLWCEVVVLATAAGIPLCIGSTPMGTPQYGQYELMIPMWKQFAAARKQGVFHIYTPNAYFPVPADEGAITHLARRHETEMLRVCAVAGIEPPPILYGEYNTVESVSQSDLGPAANGLPVQLWVHGLKAAGVQASTNIYVYGDGLYDQRWIGFNIARCPGYMEAMVNDLPRTPLTFREEYAQSIVQQPEGEPVATRLDMMQYVCPPNGKQLRLFGLGDEHARCTQEADGWVLQRKNELSEEFQVTASRIRRGADTSSLYTPDGQYKGFFYIQYTKQANGALEYGCDWCPRYMEPGETFIRNAYIVELYYDGRVKAEYPATTTLTFVQFFASFTDPQSGITLKNVIELHWGGEEHYYYAEGYGLIRWWNVRENYGSWLGTLNNVSIRPPIPHVRPRPAVPFPPQGVPTAPTVVTPANPGEGVMMTVNSRDGLKHRAEGSTGATILRTLLYQQPVMAYPATKKVADGWTWIFCTNATGEPGWSASSYLTAVPQPETWTVKRNTPYVSQQGSEAAKSPNDCRVATLLMLERDWFQETLKRVPSVPTVDDLVKYTRLSNPTPPKGLDFADVDTLAKQTGFDVDYVQPMTNEKIVAYLDQGKPVSVLVDYSKYNPSGAAIAHEIAVIGYSDNAFLTHDPYLLGSNVTITKTKLAEAMKSSPGNSVGFQGFVLSDVA